MSSITSALKKATFPTIMAIMSFLLFLFVYLRFVMYSVDPYYIKGLVFAVPFIVFGIITILTEKGELKKTPSAIITGVLIPVFGVILLIYYVFLSVGTSTTTINDISKYERVLNLSGYPENEGINFFPSQIPSEAADIEFQYTPGFLQGGEIYKLKYRITATDIQKYIDEYSVKAEWIGTQQKGDEEGNIAAWKATYLYKDKSKLPEDFIIYLLYLRPNSNWNHGEMNLVAISTQRSEIIFCSDNW